MMPLLMLLVQIFSFLRLIPSCILILRIFIETEIFGLTESL